MKIISEKSLMNFEAWSGAVETKNIIIENNKVEEFDSLIDECYPNGIDETGLNDILWFEDEWLYQNLGIEIEE